MNGASGLVAVGIFGAVGWGAAVLLFVSSRNVRRLGTQRSHSAAFPEEEDADRVDTAEMRGRLRRISHDLRSPLNSIVGALDLIDLNADDPQAVRRWSRMAANGAMRARLMVDDLNVHSSWTDDPSARFPAQLVHLSSMVQSVIAEIGRTPSGADRAITVDIADSASLVRAHRESLRHLVTNLVSNAVAHSVPGPVHIAALRTDGRTVISVRDPGSALTEADFRSLGRPFVRGAMVEGAGLGLGISVAEELIRRLGSSLDLRVDQSGTTFEFAVTSADAARPLLVVGSVGLDGSVRNRFVQLVTAAGGTVHAWGPGTAAEPFDDVIRSIGPGAIAVEIAAGLEDRVRIERAATITIDLGRPVWALIDDEVDPSRLTGFDAVIAPDVDIETILDLIEASLVT